MIDFSKLKTSKEDDTLIAKIAARAMSVPGVRSKIEIYMDLTVTHWFSRLRLDDLLHADEANFRHDISGITRHIDRDTGKLRGLFLPRYTARTFTPPKETV